MRTIWPHLALCMLAVACRQPGSFPPPAQRVDPGGHDPGELGSFIQMDDPYAAEYIVRDIANAPGPWRWTMARPELRFRVKTVRGLRFVLDFAIPPVTFRATGPVTLTCWLDGRELGSLPVPSPGRYRLEKAVPAGWVRAGVPVTVTAQTDKQYISPDDEVPLSFQLLAVGFLESK